MTTATGKIVITGNASQLQSAMQTASAAVAGFAGNATRSVTAMQQQTVAAMNGVGTSAKQTAAAMRMVPAQLTDIITQLTGGQSPITVLIQQGGQMRDMFGGFIPMFRALSTIFTPTVIGFGAIAAAIGSMIFAYERGVEESKRFNNDMRLTGNYAGITEGQFNSMARTMADGANTGIGAAREALEELVATGRFSGNTLQVVGQTALTFSHLSGQAAAAVVKDYAGMADGVAAWAAKHNEQYHFLTAAQYEHITTLEHEGQTQQAMQATMEAFNEHLKAQTENVGYLERAWHAAGNAMSDFWDRMKSVGRDSTLDDQISAAQAQLTRLELRARASQGTREGDYLKDQIADAQGTLEQLQARKDLQESDRKSAALADQLHEKAIRAIKDNEELAKSFATRQQKAKEAVKKYLDDQQAIVAAGMQGDSPEMQKKMIAAIQDKYKEPAHRDNTRLRQWQAELEEFKLSEQEKAQAEGRFYETSKQDEQKFWQQKLALTTAGGKENAAVRKQLAEIGLAIMKEQFDAEQAGLKLGITASKDAYQAQLVYMQKYVDNAREKYGEDSAQYKAALKEQEAMRQAHEVQMRQIDQIRVADARDNATAIVDQQQRVAQMDYELGLITRTQLLNLQRDYITERMRLALQAADDEIKLYKTDTVEYEKALAKKKAIERKYGGQLSQNSSDRAVDAQKPHANIFTSAQYSFEHATTGMLTKAQSWQQAMGSIFKNVGTTFVQETVSKPLAEWTAGWMRRLAMNMGFLGSENAQKASAAAIGAGIAAKSATAEIGTNAAVAGSGAASSLASIPYVGPILAAAAMASMFAAVSGMTRNVKSASGGFDVPRGLNPMTQLHEEEMVLPKHIANPLRAVLNGGGMAQGGQGNTIHYHDHSGRLTPTEIRRNAKVIADALRDYSKKQ